MRKLYIRLTVLCSIFLISSYAQQTLTTSAAFLKVSPDIRGAGLGDAGIANTPDAYSTFRNIAKIPFAENRASIAASYTPWMQNIANDIYMAALNGFIRLDDNQALTASLRFFKVGEATFRDDAGNYIGTFSPRDFSIDAGYSRKIAAKLGVGVTLRYINSRIASGNLNGDTYKTGSSIAGDASLYYNGIKEGSGFTAGINLSNLGSKISYNTTNSGGFLPAALGIGVGYTIKIGEDKFTMIAEVDKTLVPVTPEDNASMEAYNNMSLPESWFKSFNSGNIKWMQYKAGIEYNWNDLLFLRAGGLIDGKARTHADEKLYFTLGAGLKYKSAQVDFSLLGGDFVGTDGLPYVNTFRVGISYNIFGTAK